MAALEEGDGTVEPVLTPITTMAGLAAQDYSFANSVSTVPWVTENDAKVCPRCADDEVTAPDQKWQSFQSGDATPPTHPRCRCALVRDWA